MGVSSNAPAGTKIHTVLSGWIIFAYTMSGTLAVLFCCIGSYCFITRCCLKRKARPRYQPNLSQDSDSDDVNINKSRKIRSVPTLEKQSPVAT